MRRRGVIVGGGLLAACLLASSAHAQPPPSPHGEQPPRKVIHAIRIRGASPRLDGHLDDPAWRDVPFVSDFLQKEPTEGAPPLERTEVGFLYDDRALWIAARMYSDHPETIRRLVSRRDQPGNTERIIISLDTYCDRRTAYSFALSVTGVRSDYYHPGDDEFWRDRSYDPVWEGRTASDSTGWTAEIRIPFSQLRFNDVPEQVWGVNLNRWVPLRNEDDFWIFVPRNTKGWASHFGDLVGIEGIHPSRRLEILPYVAGDAALSNDVAAGDPFRSTSDSEGRAGADLKMGLGPNLTLDGTVNPDFGQVEADPAQINLTQFETIFDERRPFFIEGSQVLRGDGPAYFYSRRIGAPPPGDASGDFVERPKDTTILGAAKLTGRLASGLSIGGLAALTDREYARVYDTATGITDRTAIAPRTGWGVVRLQQEFGAARSTVGASFTGVSRDLSSGNDLADLLNRHAYSGGGDWNLRFHGGDYEVAGFAGFSYVDGNPADILGIQTSSARYYQRPDAGHVHVDSTRTALGGWTTALRAERVGGARWLWGSGLTLESPGFELNDAGLLQSSDDIDGWAQLHYRETQPGPVFRDYDIRLTTDGGLNFGGVRKSTSFYLEGESTWKNFLHTYVSGIRGLGGLSDDHTRGGPLFLIPGFWSTDVSLNNNFAATTRWTAGAGYVRNDLAGWGSYVEGSYTRRVGDRLEASLLPSYSRSLAKRQYVDALAGGPPETFGTRYVFAQLEESTLRLQIRATYAFTPDLTLEAYAEPFSSTGRWDRFGELRGARTNDLRYYGQEGTTITRAPNDDLTITDGPDTLFISHDDYLGDFEGLSFRSSLVLRWEWRRGSTFYFIWQADRSDFVQSRELVRPGDLWNSLSSPGTDVLAVKATYWFAAD
jgi:Domain of unknown function (DUF5916)